MIWQLLGLYFRAAGTTFIPWLIPFLYAAIAGLVMQGMDPLLLSLVLFSGAACGTTCLWLLDTYLDIRLNKKFPKMQTYHKNMDSRL
jgi:membrane protein YqaA with SNARE-associated domain